MVPQRDPLVLDLDGDGIETTGRLDPVVTFDHDGDGVKTGTGWIRPDDGWLVRDLNANGSIDTGAELFGVDTVKRDGSKAKDGFDALAELDSSGDELIDSKDAVFASLRIWRDLNQDGVSQKDELKTLADSGIASIGAKGVNQLVDLGNGNVQAAQGTYTRINGSTGDTGETTAAAANLNLLVNTFYRTFSTSVPLSETAQGLPEMRGSGQVRDLREAMSLSDGLAQWVQNYAEQSTWQGQQGLLDGLVQRWADTSRMLPLKAQADALAGSGVTLTYELDGLQAGTIDYDSFLTKLGVVERFMGFTFGGANGQARYAALDADSGKLTVRLMFEQVGFIDRTYGLILQDVYEALLLDTRFKTVLNELSLKQVEQNWGLDWTGVKEHFNEAIAADLASGLVDLVQFVSKTKPLLGQDGLKPMVDYMLAELAQAPDIDALSVQLGDLGLRVSGAGYSSLQGTAGKDVLVGGSGANTLMGGNGDDLLIGKGGSDIIKGGSGNDTYVLNKGDGADTISDSGSWGQASGNADLLRLGEGLTVAAAVVGRVGDSLNLSWAGGDSVSISDYFSWDGRGRVETILFADGTEWKAADAAQRQLGTSGDDDFRGISEVANKMQGLAGDDTLLGGSLGDTLDGGAGNDSLEGGAGNDSLVGGAGNDKLDGGSGDDTYIFNQGDGADTISDYKSWDDTDGDADLLKLGAGLSAAAAVVGRVGDSLNLSWAGGDSVSISNYFSWDGRGRVETILFADGTKWQVADAAQRQLGSHEDDNFYGVPDVANAMRGLAGDDTLLGGGEADLRDGGAGNDSLGGGAGNDTLTGGTGNDKLDGGSGDDTYLFNQGDGADTISDYKSSNDTDGDADVLKLGAGLSAAAAVVGRLGDSLNLSWAGGDSVSISNYFGWSGNERVETIHFADGIEWTVADIAQRQVGTSGGDDFYGIRDVANKMQGLAGNDTLVGGSLADTLDGGAGNDELNGGEGNDTFYDAGGADTVYGGEGDDLIRTTLAWEQNRYDGGAGSDTVDYSVQSYNGIRAYGGFGGTGGIWVDLVAGQAWRYRYGAQYYDGIPDTLVSIENAIGSNLRDYLAGDA